MLNMNPGAEYAFNYVGQDGELTTRTILFTGLTVNGNKGKLYLRGLDVKKGEYRTFDVDNIDIMSVQHVRG